MIITLKGADFSSSNIGTLSTWTVSRVLGSGATYSGATLVDKGAALNATVTIADGYEIGPDCVTVTMGGIGQAYNMDGNVITISIAQVTGNVMIKVPTVNIVTGDEEVPGGDVVDPDTSVFYNNYRLENDVQLASSGSDPYSVSAKTGGYRTFFDIPVEPNTMYCIIGSVRVTMMTKAKVKVDSINVYTESTVGKQYYFKTTGTTAYINVTILDSKVAIEEARLSTANVSRTVNSSSKVAESGAIFIDNAKLSRSAYSEQEDESYFTWKEIPVEPNTYYYLKGTSRVWFLDSSKTKLTSVNPTTGGAAEQFDIYAPAKAAYVSATFYKPNSDAANDVELTNLTVEIVANN